VSGRFLLDTNIIIGLLKRESSILEAVTAASELFVPVIALGELYFGAARSSRPDANRAVLDQFVDGRIVLFCDLLVAREYGRLKSELKAQ
jgi:tRNA(fMet)-specific endonuclease VapC